MRYEDDPKGYWERRLGRSFDLRGVGHIDFGGSYNRWLYLRKDRCLGRALAGLDLRGRRILDVGCGTGHFVDWYHRRGALVSGVDITEASIDSMRRRFSGEFIVCDVASREVNLGGPYFLVNMFDVIYHVVERERFESVLRNISSCLIRGGYLLLTDRFGAPTDFRASDHVQFRSLTTYRTAMHSLGFELVAVRPLFHLLNRRVTALRVDNLLGALYYGADSLRRDIAPANLSLGVWRKSSLS